MKKFITILAIALAAVLAISSCTKEVKPGAGTITVNGTTYNDVDAYYWIENNHFFNLRLVMGNRKVTAFGMLDTPMALGEDLKGRTVNINSETGSGDILFLDFQNPTYNMMPAKGKQSFKKSGDNYKVILDVTDTNGNKFVMDVIAVKEALGGK